MRGHFGAPWTSTGCLRRAGYYATRHGHMPLRRYALHGGEVASGEVGNLKREVVYLGDTIHTVAHMEDLGSQLDEPILISGDLLSRMTLPRKVSAVPVSAIRPKGKDRDVEVFAIKPKRSVGSSSGVSGVKPRSASWTHALIVQGLGTMARHSSDPHRPGLGS